MITQPPVSFRSRQILTSTMPPARRPLQKLSASKANQSQRRGPKPKPLEEYSELATLQVNPHSGTASGIRVLNQFR